MMNFVFKLRIFLIALFLIITVSSFNTYSQQLWTLESCIDYAYENNLNIRRQELGVKISEENLTQSMSERFPNLNVNATHGYNYGRTIDPFTNEFATERVRTNNFSVSSGIVLFNGFRVTNAIRQNRIELDASKYDVEAIKNDISLAIASAYLEILFSKELVDVTEGQLEIIRQQVERMKRFVEAGTVSRGNLFTIEAQVASEELRLVNAINRLRMAYIDLAQMLDLRDTDNFEIHVPEIEIKDKELLDMPPLEIYQIAVGIQPDVLASQMRIKSSEKDVEIARGMRYPRLAMQGSYGTGYSGASREIVNGANGEGELGDFQTRIVPFNEQLDQNLNRSIGLYLTIPIFNNYQTRSAINRSFVSLENSKLINQQLRNQVFKDIQQAHADANAAITKYMATVKNVEALKESFNYTEQRFNIGMADPLEYNDAKNRLATAESEMLQAKYEYVFMMRILDFYMGNPITLNNQ